MTRFSVNDSIDTLVDQVPAMVAGRAHVDMVPVFVDVPCSDDFSTEIARAGNVTVYPTCGFALVDVLGIAALRSPAPVLQSIYRTNFGSDASAHPIDVTFNQQRIHPDATAIIYAGSLEWLSEFMQTAKLHARLPGGTIHVVACTCAAERKISDLAAHALGGVVRSLSFTEECRGLATMRRIVDAFLASGGSSV